MFRRDSQEIYRAVPFEQFDWLEHSFGTRHSRTRQDGWQVVTLRQVHSSTVLVVDGAAGSLGDGDALISDRPGYLLEVRTADCLPILMVDERRRIVAAVHAGWRGTASRVAAETVHILRTKFGTQPQNLHVAIGPGIGVCCYEVGREVASHFHDLFPELRRLAGRVKLDLTEANRRQLVSLGISPSRIHAGGLCTCCDSDQFHSYRRDSSQAGRMISAIGIRTNY